MHQGFKFVNFRYCYEKNAELLKTRGIGFEEIIYAISEGNILDIRMHLNEDKYSNQKIFYIRVLEEVYVVPYVEEKNNGIFLKTLFPSRKAKARRAFFSE